MEKDQLQTIKLEISKYSQLLPYERIAFHKILGILKTENGMKVLLRDLNKDYLIRESAISTLSDFNYKEVSNAFVSLLEMKIDDTEKVEILEHLERYGTSESIPHVIKLIENNKENPESLSVVSEAFNVLRCIGCDSDETREYLKRIALNKEYNQDLRSFAIVSLSFSKEIISSSTSEKKSIIEEVLKEESEELTYAAYKAIAILSDNLLKRVEEDKSDDDNLFTYSPESEDKVILDIRVLLGKMTPYFDSYSNRIKVVFLSAMISSNHREFLIYTMKALTSDDPEIIDMTLNLLLSDIQKLRDPDKLFRNLIALSVDTPRGSEIIVDIFETYFINLKEIRRNLLLKDKLYNYIVVTLEAYFESFRKDYMITEVIEKDYPKNFQKIRNFILEKFNSTIKKKIINYLRQIDTSNLHDILSDISEKIHYIEDKDNEGLNCLLEILYDKDAKSRDISASRIEDVNHEKRYLKDRIIRLCKIIGRLKIDNAASPMVIIYNYVKKYPDNDILDVVTSTLSILNYSYMLGELEVVLATGDSSEQEKAIRYLSLFSDQRSLNIILDSLRQNPEEDSELTIKLLNTLLAQDISGNVSANQILKKIIEANSNPNIRMLAILSLGRCGKEADLSYLNELFFSLRENDPKAAIVQSIEHIINLSVDFNKRQIIKQLQEYLKDPGIKVRIYSCFLLIHLGDKNALKSIKDMMTIKNKNIQREILSILGNLKSVEFAYFLISLLKDEYAISSDIIPVLELLPEEELREIDHFIVNIFKKHEFVDFDANEGIKILEKSKPIQGIIDIETSILNIEILNFQKTIESLSISELTMLYKKISDIVISVITENNGTITRITNGRILSYFPDVHPASNAGLNIYNNFKVLNKMRLPKDRIDISILLVSDKVRIINEEIVNFSRLKSSIFKSAIIKNKILIDDKTRLIIENGLYSEPIPELTFNQGGSVTEFYELVCPINFLAVSEKKVFQLTRDEKEQIKQDIEFESELKKRQKPERKSSTAIAYAQALDDIGRTLKEDLNNVNKYVQMRTTDRELIGNIEKMLTKVYKKFFVEKSKLFIEIE